MAEHLIFALYVAIPLALAGGLLALSRWDGWRMRVPSWVRLVTVNFIVLLFLLSLVFVMGEGYYRFIFDESDSINYTQVSQRWFNRYYHENRVGFRDDLEYVPEKPAGRRRVSFVGDSFLSGHGIKSVKDRFPNLIRAAHPEWEIHVLANLGLDTGDELQLMERVFSLGYQTDEVVLVYCVNDVADIMPEWAEALHQLFLEAHHPNWLLRNSYLINTIYYHYQAAHAPVLKNYYGFVREGYQGQLWETQKRRLKQFRALVESHGARFSVITYPFVHAVGPDYPLVEAHQRLDEFWTGLKVPHLDLLPVFSGQQPATITVNRYDPHPNEYANRLAAERIEPFLVEQMKEVQ